MGAFSTNRRPLEWGRRWGKLHLIALSQATKRFLAAGSPVCLHWRAHLALISRRAMVVQPQRPEPQRDTLLGGGEVTITRHQTAITTARYQSEAQLVC